MAHNLQNKESANGCTPSIPAPQQNEGEYCEGKILIPCCCPRIYSRTFRVELGPRTIPQLGTAVGGTASAYEAAGYIILGHSLTDTGAGWIFFFTVGWYA